MYLRARYYDSEIGRFGSEDPIRDGVNWYVYCDSNPVMYHDPSGEKYIVDDIWNDMGQRSDTMMADPSTYNVTNWLSMGFVETLKGSVNPEKALSLQHWVDSATVVTAVYGGYSAGSAASKAVVKSSAKKTAKTGSNNIANGAKLNAQLTFQEANAIFAKGGQLKKEVIKNSDMIIRGENLNNKKVISALTKDGSKISDWNKMTTNTFKSPSGNFQVHFYQNSKTGKVSTYEMKVKFDK